MAGRSLKFIGLIRVFFLFTFGITLYAQTKVTDYVNPLIGTAGHGHTFPVLQCRSAWCS